MEMQQAESEKFNLKNQIEDLQNSLDQATDKLGDFNSSRFSVIEDTQEKYRQRIEELEHELDAVKDRNEQEMRDLSSKSEEQIA
jgi:predicted  nucleic acid-binding Zn-ribbon protein